MSTVWTVVHVDDQQEHRDDVREQLEGERFAFGDVKVVSLASFSEAASRLAAGEGDVVVLDVVDDDGTADPNQAGRRIFERVRASRFVPVMFYTGFGHQLAALKSELPLVEVIAKGAGGIEGVSSALQGFFDDGLPQLHRALVLHVETVQRDWMWDWLAVQWPELSAFTDPGDRAHLLARRLAWELSGPKVATLAAELGGEPVPQREAGELVHPMRCYVMPPLSGSRRLAGDVMKGKLGGRDGWWVVLTPSCDFARIDPDDVMVAECVLLADQPEYKAFASDPTKNNRKQLELLASNNKPAQGRQQDRYHHLPAALAVPGLLADLRRVVVCTWNDFDALDRVASLDSPYAESMLHQFARYVGRLGTPDLDTNVVLEAASANAAAKNPSPPPPPPRA